MRRIMPTTEPNITIANDNNSIQLDVMAFQAPDIMSKIKSDISVISEKKAVESMQHLHYFLFKTFNIN